MNLGIIPSMSQVTNLPEPLSPKGAKVYVGCNRVGGMDPGSLEVRSKHVSDHGYVKVLVPDHPRSDRYGYYYEHRLVAERKLGRLLDEDEIVHHINEDKQDNRWENLKVVEGNAEHFREHGRHDPDTRDPGEENPEIECACGCGLTFKKYDDWGRPREYITGHNVADGPPTQLLVRQYLEENGRCKLVGIVEDIDRTRSAISNALGELKEKGEVDNPEYGYWEAV